VWVVVMAVLSVGAAPARLGWLVPVSVRGV